MHFKTEISHWNKLLIKAANSSFLLAFKSTITDFLKISISQTQVMKPDKGRTVWMLKSSDVQEVRLHALVISSILKRSEWIQHCTFLQHNDQNSANPPFSSPPFYVFLQKIETITLCLSMIAFLFSTLLNLDKKQNSLYDPLTLIWH